MISKKAEKRIAELKALGHTNEKAFPGEYTLLIRNSDMGTFRVYDDGEVWWKSNKSGSYGRVGDEWLARYMKRSLNVLGNITAAGYVYDADFKSAGIEERRVRMVWKCRGCNNSITTSVETHIHGTPYCQECNGHYTLTDIESKGLT